MDIIRLLLLQQESGIDPPELGQLDEKLVVYNAALMIDAKLVEGSVALDNEAQPMSVFIYRMTWAGHDFLDSIRDPSVWAKAKERIIKPGASWTFSILRDFLKAEAQRQLGNILGLSAGP